MRTLLAGTYGVVRRDDRGVTGAEYGLIAAVIITMIVGLVWLYAAQVAELFGQYQIPE
ncbi:Flp pilus assembly pilin Flp [Allocatelliglobosispora scoriae]|uniref:Flp pilus assembly pilin Flp n=1 Tax=Allocatelliglobosispora scoriae TaxID=643052 RepID=A0A841BU43_9ACTN|nr:Flp family type IVb pilin [Allocatelliglobosispora scoriae]MBB5870956.1 Flp pilus assembly pilin Flp [Allocatelliglobosispora scoriae]